MRKFRILTSTSALKSKISIAEITQISHALIKVDRSLASDPFSIFTLQQTKDLVFQKAAETKSLSTQSLVQRCIYENWILNLEKRLQKIQRIQ